MTFAGFICVITIVLGAANAAQSKVEEPPQCRNGLVVECLGTEDMVWSMENSVCKPYLNRCIFNKDNCRKYHDNEPLLTEVPKAECQQNCIVCATTTAERVCAKRGNNYCYFNGACALQQHICTNAEMWSRELDRFCDEQQATSVCP